MNLWAVLDYCGFLSLFYFILFYFILFYFILFYFMSLLSMLVYNFVYGKGKKLRVVHIGFLRLTHCQVAEGLSAGGSKVLKLRKIFLDA
jgi:hypothetical protein